MNKPTNLQVLQWYVSSCIKNGQAELVNSFTTAELISDLEFEFEMQSGDVTKAMLYDLENKDRPVPAVHNKPPKFN